jgi:hypothetical protein
MLKQEALAEQSGRVIRDPPQLGLHGLDLLTLLRGQIFSPDARSLALIPTGGLVATYLGAAWPSIGLGLFSVRRVLFPRQLDFPFAIEGALAEVTRIRLVARTLSGRRGLGVGLPLVHGRFALGVIGLTALGLICLTGPLSTGRVLSFTGSLGPPTHLIRGLFFSGFGLGGLFGRIVALAALSALGLSLTSLGPGLGLL